jgi:hypothetical protein
VPAVTTAQLPKVNQQAMLPQQQLAKLATNQRHRLLVHHSAMLVLKQAHVLLVMA